MNIWREFAKAYMDYTTCFWRNYPNVIVNINRCRIVRNDNIIHYNFPELGEKNSSYKIETTVTMKFQTEEEAKDYFQRIVKVREKSHL
jgi:hypothetical protein